MGLQGHLVLQGQLDTGVASRSSDNLEAHFHFLKAFISSGLVTMGSRSAQASTCYLGRGIYDLLISILTSRWPSDVKSMLVQPRYFLIVQVMLPLPSRTLSASSMSYDKMSNKLDAPDTECSTQRSFDTCFIICPYFNLKLNELCNVATRFL
jgi:hypothetical protein